MNCKCHGEPAYWNRDKRKSKGGVWRCSVKKREYQRERYDADAVHRIEKNLHDHARRRADTLKRRRENLGALQIEG